MVSHEQKATGTHGVVFDSYGETGGVYFCRMKVGDFTATKKFIPVKSHIRGKRLGSRTAKGLRFRRALSHHFPQSDNVLRRRLDVRLQVVWKAATHLFTHSPIPGFFLAAVGAMAQAATTLEVFAAHAAHI